ncbi:MAG: glycosyltransferase [Bacteroidaceae bacterium]|nr:glycosyltransferase [Bacteroidaceae bacterium]
MLPLISFIVTYHNEPEDFLRACLESIQALPFADGEAEIIVVDDGSQNQFKIQNSSQSSGAGGTKFKVIRQEQAGLSVARNTGIDAASGRYIQFVDADDCLIPATYEAVLEQVRRESADVILFRMTQKPPLFPPSQAPQLLRYQRAIAPFGGVLQEVQLGHSPKGGEGGGFLLHRNLRAAAWGYAFKREILGDLRFCPGLLHEDELFTPQLLLRADSLVELGVKAYFYRQHEGTITHSKSSEKIQKRLNDIHFIIRELQRLENPVLERRIRQLTVDYLQKTLTLTHSFAELRCRTKELRREGLLPLPLRFYSLRYVLFALLSRALPVFL